MKQAPADTCSLSSVPPLSPSDELEIEQEGAVPVEPTPAQLLDGGHHFDDVDDHYVQRLTRRLVQSSTGENRHYLPRNLLHTIVANANLTRPPPPPQK